MKFLITGATGYLGSNLIHLLNEQGHSIVGIKRRSSDTEKLAPILGDIELFDLDSFDFPSIFQDSNSFDAIIHTATDYGRNEDLLSSLVEANCLFPLRLLETAAMFDTKIFINADTSLTKYISNYSLSKKQFLELGKYFSKQRHICFINVLLEHIYGPGDNETKFISKVIKHCMENKNELELTAGAQQRDFVYIDDVLSAFETLLQDSTLRGSKNAYFQEYAVGSGRAVTIKDIVTQIHSLCESEITLQFGAIPYRTNEVFFSKADLSSMKEIGWYPRYTLLEGLEMTIQMERKRYGK